MYEIENPNVPSQVRKSSAGSKCLFVTASWIKMIRLSTAFRHFEIPTIERFRSSIVFCRISSRALRWSSFSPIALMFSCKHLFVSSNLLEFNWSSSDSAFSFEIVKRNEALLFFSSSSIHFSSSNLALIIEKSKWEKELIL